jgi:geranylgeranyl diphosphate synthase, type II
MSEPGDAVKPFSVWLEAQVLRFDAALAEIAAQLPDPIQSRVAAAVRYAIRGEGKRLRPALCIASFRAVRPHADDDPVVPIACAIELIHTYSLVHDDLPCMDDDDLRRGRPTVHVVHGTPAATYAGASLIPLAFATLLRGFERLGLTDSARRTGALDLARACGAAGMVGGQVLDLEAEGRATSLEDLEYLHLAKTGALISASARLGALAADASVDVLQALRLYGRCVGLAFQIVDDVLDVTSSTRRLGKTSGKDREVAKATFPAFMGLEGARERAEQEVEKALAALDVAGLRTSELEGLARFAIERQH